MALAAEIVITGGPCAGKTTGMARLRQWLEELGFRVLVAPELATTYILGGVNDTGRLATEDRPAFLVLERVVLESGVERRRYYQALAKEVYSEEQVVVLYDRGEMDIAAYVEPREFRSLLEQARLTLADVRDSYDLVVHLMTAADGAEEYYTTANNDARSETPEQARALDARTRDAWIGHPKLRVVDNHTDFAAKLARLMQIVARVIELPVPTEIERKFLLTTAPDLTHSALGTVQCVEIEQAYLKATAGEEVRIRRRYQHGGATYYQATKTRLRPGVATEQERLITPADYERLMQLRDPACQVVEKLRYCFIYRGQYFELDHILAPATRECWLLELELTEENQVVRLPDFLRVEREVTADSAYSNRVIALG